MNKLIIPRKLIQSDDLIIVPRKEYEALLYFKRFREFTPTPAQIKALKQAEQNRKKGKFLTLDELQSKLGLRS